MNIITSLKIKTNFIFALRIISALFLFTLNITMSIIFLIIIIQQYDNFQQAFLLFLICTVFCFNELIAILLITYASLVKSKLSYIISCLTTFGTYISRHDSKKIIYSYQAIKNDCIRIQKFFLFSDKKTINLVLTYLDNKTLEHSKVYFYNIDISISRNFIFEFSTLEHLFHHFNQFVAIKNNIKSFLVILESSSFDESQTISLGYSIINSIDKYLSNSQDYIKKVLLKQYKHIIKLLEDKQDPDSINTLCINLYRSIKNHIKEFDNDNTTLSNSIQIKLSNIFDFCEKYNIKYFSTNKHFVDSMKGQDFENFCAHLLLSYGFANITVTKGSGDQGVDIIAYYNGLKHAIQCKRYNNKLGNTPIQEVVAGKNYYNCQVAIVITNNYFTESAKSLAKANSVELWDRDMLNRLIYISDNQWKNLLNELNN